MSNKIERFTQRARRVLSLAQEEAERMSHAHLGTEHLLLGLMREDGGVAGRVLRELGVKTRDVQELIVRLSDASRDPRLQKIDLSPGTRRVLELAVDEARRMGHHYIGTEHVLLGLVRQNEGMGVDVLKKLGISAEQIRRHTRRVLQESPVQAASRAEARPAKFYSLALLGFGNVGKALVKLLQTKRDELRDRYGIGWRITGVASRSIGWQVNPDGFSTDALLAGDYDAPLYASDMSYWLKAAQPDIFFENTSMNPHTGQPATDHIRAALDYGAHVVTANKGPIVHAYRELRDLAAAKGKQFLFEATVMGGAPIFSLFREALPATELRRFRGILNSTTNVILTEMENGLSFDEGVKKAQAMGIAETDPSADVDGWDAAVKVAALVNVLMDVSAPLKLEEIQVEGIRGLTAEMVQTARVVGRSFKLVCQAERTQGNKAVAHVRPEQVPLSDPLANVRGSDSIIHFEMDTLHGLTLSEQGADANTTAYGLLADLITIARDAPR